MDIRDQFYFIVCRTYVHGTQIQKFHVQTSPLFRNVLHTEQILSVRVSFSMLLCSLLFIISFYENVLYQSAVPLVVRLSSTTIPLSLFLIINHFPFFLSKITCYTPHDFSVLHIKQFVRTVQLHRLCSIVEIYFISFSAVLSCRDINKNSYHIIFIRFTKNLN